MEIDRLYNLFYEKLPAGIEEVMPKYEGCQIVTCLNAYYLIKLKPEDYHWYEEFDYIASDGIWPLKIQKVLGMGKSKRLSFDNTSMAIPVFQDMIKNNESLYILGAKPEEVEKSVNTIKTTVTGIKIAGFHHGYIKDCKEQIIEEVLKSGAKVVIIGMGAPMQDEMAVLLKKAGFIGSVYTCGGFIHQTQNSIVAFPQWVSKLGLRTFYRIFVQKGIIRRMIETHPKFIYTYTRFLLKKRHNR